jgi:hypothetical protein
MDVGFLKKAGALIENAQFYRVRLADARRFWKDIQVRGKGRGLSNSSDCPSTGEQRFACRR